MRTMLVAGCFLCLGSVVQAQTTESPSAGDAASTAPGVTTEAVGSAPAAPAKKEEKAAPVNAMANPNAIGGGSRKLSLTWSFQTSVGNGAFVANDGARNPTWSQWLMLQPSYRIDPATTIALRTTWNYELITTPDTDNGRRFSPDDWTILLNRNVLKEKDSGVGLLIGPRATIPVSYESRWAGRYSTVSLAAVLMKTLWNQSFMLTLSGGKNLSRYTSQVVTADEQTAADNGGWNSTGLSSSATSASVRQIVNCRYGESICSGGDMLTNWSTAAMLGVGGELPIPRFSYFAMLRLGAAWRYNRPVDQYTPKLTDSNGRPVVDGSNRTSDNTYGYLSVSYAASDTISVDLALMSFQPGLIYQADGASGAGRWAPRFPFWDFSGPANNLSSFGLSVNGFI